MINQEIIKLYKERRQPHTGRYAGSGAIYHHVTPAAFALKSAKNYYDITTQWENAGDKVKINVLPDHYISIDALAGDSFNPECNPTINPTLLEKQYKEFIERVDRSGACGIQGSYKCPCCGSWISADSVWGFVGNDYIESGYLEDVKYLTLKAAGLYQENI